MNFKELAPKLPLLRDGLEPPVRILLQVGRWLALLADSDHWGELQAAKLWVGRVLVAVRVRVAHWQRAARQQAARQRAARQRAARQRAARQRAARQRAARQRAAHQRLEHRRLEHRRLEHQRLEHQRLEHQRLEHQRLEQVLPVPEELRNYSGNPPQQYRWPPSSPLPSRPYRHMVSM